MSATGQTVLLGRFRDNIVATGLSPTASLVGFLLAWGAFLFILFVLPLPEGLTPAGKAAMAVVVWATVMWIFESMPVGWAMRSCPALARYCTRRSSRG